MMAMVKEELTHQKSRRRFVAEPIDTLSVESKKKSDLIRVFVKGGILSPADLLKIMNISESLGNNYILFGSRQDLMFPANGTDEQTIERHFRPLNTDYELGSDQSEYQNIVSSYVAVNVLETTPWVKEDTYHVVMDNFDYKPKLKINIVDPMQAIVPLFTGELNFIASKEENYWYLYVRDPRKEKAECWPRLVASNEIARLSKVLEDAFIGYQPFTIQELFTIAYNTLHRIVYKPLPGSLKFPLVSFPYYEGFNAMQNSNFWLGLYWRNNQYDINFITAACRLCQDTNIGKVSIIPWKAFIIKGIKPVDKIRWEKLMGKFGINERHSSLELNWHLPVIDQKALELKRFLVRELDQQDISTHGLTFTIKTSRRIFYFTSIVIEQHEENQDLPGERYSILYARDFNPNTFEYIVYARNVMKEIIPALLIELSKIYYRQLNPERENGSTPVVPTEMHRLVSSYQCSNCLTIYDKLYGDPEHNIPAGTPFEKLPESYLCHVCDSPKKYFIPVSS
jgi:rubredoxin